MERKREAGKCVLIKKAERERRGKYKGERAKNGRDLNFFFEKNQVYVTGG